MDEVFTCICGEQNVWQIGDGYIMCTICATKYCLPFNATEFNNRRNKFISEITKETSERYSIKLITEQIQDVIGNSPL